MLVGNHCIYWDTGDFWVFGKKDRGEMYSWLEGEQWWE